MKVPKSIVKCKASLHSKQSLGEHELKSMIEQDFSWPDQDEMYDRLMLGTEEMYSESSHVLRPLDHGTDEFSETFISPSVRYTRPTTNLSSSPGSICISPTPDSRLYTAFKPESKQQLYRQKTEILPKSSEESSEKKSHRTLSDLGMSAGRDLFATRQKSESLPYRKGISNTPGGTGFFNHNRVSSRNTNTRNETIENAERRC